MTRADEFSNFLQSQTRGHTQWLRTALALTILGTAFDDLGIGLTNEELERDLNFGRSS